MKNIHHENGRDGDLDMAQKLGLSDDGHLGFIKIEDGKICRGCGRCLRDGEGEFVDMAHERWDCTHGHGVELFLRQQDACPSLKE